MLPAQALRSQNTQNSAIGFSIYVVSEGNDDVSGLVQQQGFSSQGHPHSVWTPYGELGWRVFYAPSSVVQRLIPERAPYSQQMPNNNNAAMMPNSNTAHGSISRTPSQPIPMRPQQQQQQQYSQQPSTNADTNASAQSFHPQRDMTIVRRDSTPAPTMTTRSAPQHTGRGMYQRSKSDVSDVLYNHGHQQQQQPLSTSPHQQSFQPQQQQQQQQQYSNSPSTGAPRGISSSPVSNPPPKNLSGLSLAMMTLSDNGDDDMVDNDNDNNKNNTTNGGTDNTANSEAAEKRRAALHHAPPQLPQSSSNSLNKNKSPLASAGEYGYAYNNHIPQMRANNNNPLLSAQSPMAHTPLGSTPPGYLLGGPTPPPATANWSNLIPPRGAVTPPFTRPMGFVGEPVVAPSQPLPPPAHSNSMAMGTTVASSSLNQQQQHQHLAHSNGVAALLVPTTSLDLLHSSPFRQPIYGSHYNFGSGMMAADPFASSMGSGPAAGGSEVAFCSSPGGGGSGLTMKMRTMNTMLHPRLQEQEDPDENIMPFAVDDGADDRHREPANTNSLTASSGSTLILRDMIQPPKRLQLFESTTTTTGAAAASTSVSVSQSMAHTDFADQLAEFKSFGASLLGASSLQQPGGGSGEVEAT
jgi:hypothetical protein